MEPSTTAPPGRKPADQDLAEQARPGHGIPSQDPSPEAQVPLAPAEAAREAGSVLTGGGVVAGVATGASIGAAIGGPLGAVVGATLGAVGGALGGAAAGAAASPEDPGSAMPAPVDPVRPDAEGSHDG